MKKLFVAGALFLMAACGSGANTNNTTDSASPAPGISDGSNTIGADTSHIDTSVSKIKNDSAK